MRAIGLPHEAHPPLRINADTVLPFTIPFQCFQTVSRRDSQAIQLDSSVKLKQLAARNSFNILETWHILAMEERFGMCTRK